MTLGVDFRKEEKMCLSSGGGGQTYTTPVTPQTATRPDEADASVDSAKVSAQKKALAAKGSEEDNLTGGLGTTGAAKTKKNTLLGSA